MNIMNYTNVNPTDLDIIAKKMLVVGGLYCFDGSGITDRVMPFLIQKIMPAPIEGKPPTLRRWLVNQEVAIKPGEPVMFVGTFDLWAGRDQSVLLVNRHAFLVGEEVGTTDSHNVTRYVRPYGYPGW